MGTTTDTVSRVYYSAPLTHIIYPYMCVTTSIVLTFEFIKTIYILELGVMASIHSIFLLF